MSSYPGGRGVRGGGNKYIWDWNPIFVTERRKVTAGEREKKKKDQVLIEKGRKFKAKGNVIKNHIFIHFC
jgi:hypothetical protein